MTTEIRKTYDHVKPAEYELALREENTLMVQQQRLKRKIASLKADIKNKYVYKEVTGEKTKKGKLKRERKTLRTIDVEDFRATVYQLQAELFETSQQLAKARSRVFDMNRSLKYFSKLEKHIMVERARADRNEETYIRHFERSMNRMFSNGYANMRDAVKEQIRVNAKEAQTTVMGLLDVANPAMHIVLKDRVALREKCFAHYFGALKESVAVSSK